MTIEPNARRIDWLDYARLCSAIAVMLFHYLDFGPSHGLAPTELTSASLLSIAGYGYLGVDFFFIVSGFVIMLSVHGRTARAFAAARIIRLYPGFVACMTATALVLFAAQRPDLPVSLMQWLANLTMVASLFGQLNMDGVYWSLAFELAFYGVVWLLMLLWVGRLETATCWWIALQLLGCLVVRVPFFSGYFTLFAAGCMFAFAREGGWNVRRLLFVTLAFALSLHEAARRELVALHHDPLVAMGITTGFFVIFAAFHHFDPRLPLARFVGSLTYPVYLLHANIGYVLLTDGVPVPLVALVILIAAAAIAQLVERKPRAFYQRVARAVLDKLPNAPSQRAAEGSTR